MSVGGYVCVYVWDAYSKTLYRNREACTGITLGLWLNNIECKNSIIFGVGKRSFGVNRSQIVRPL